MLLNYLSKTSKLREIVFEKNVNSRDEKSMQKFMKGLESNKTLITLKLIANSLGFSSNHLDYLGKALKSYTTIINLILSDNLIDIKSCSLKEFNAGMCKNIKQLYFSNCNLHFDSMNVMYLADALKTLKGLIVLDLSRNDLGKRLIKVSSNKNLVQIMEALIECKKLSVLNFSCNSLYSYEEGVFAFLDAFAEMDSLTELHLSDNLFASKKDALNKFSEIMNTKKTY